MNSSTPDAGIPLLTEILPLADEPPGDGGETLSPAREVRDAGTSTAIGPLPESGTAATLPASDWNRLEDALQARIVERLQAQMEGVLQDRIRDNLADMLQIATESISRELRHTLHESLSNIVGQAVAHEIAKLKGEK
ncbi:MAG: hypothetical protein ACTHKB_04740 [Burkholderiaceae bacterium]